MVLMQSGSISLWSVHESFIVVDHGEETVFPDIDIAANVYLSRVNWESGIKDDVSQSFYRTDGAGFTKTNRF